MRQGPSETVVDFSRRVRDISAKAWPDCPDSVRSSLAKHSFVSGLSNVDDRSRVERVEELTALSWEQAIRVAQVNEIGRTESVRVHFAD